ncbi:MAG: hypothetical protein ACKV2T_10880 [Kofleriaceae bacterium]
MTKALLVLLALATPALAEINMADSVEWQTIDSDVVVRGFVVKQEPKTIGDGKWWDITFKITETVKGSAKKTLRFGVRDNGGVAAGGWAKTKVDLLLFLVEGKTVADDKDAAQFPFALRRGMGSSASAITLGTSPVYTSAFATLTKATDVLAAARLAAKSIATMVHRVDVPWDTPAMNSLYSGSAVWMNVPVDGALEKLALVWIKDNSVNTREEGAMALAHFKSDTNVAHMKALLADSGFSEGTFDSVDNQRRYIVRKVAHEALEKWNVPHANPLIQETIKKKK